MTPQSLLTLGVVATLIGATLLYRDLRRYRHWPHTTAVLTGARLTGTTHHSSERDAFDLWYLRVTYKYRVDGHDYTGAWETNWRGQGSAAGEAYQRAAEQYRRVPPGAQFDIWCAPWYAGDSYVEFSAHGWAFGTSTAGLAAILVAIAWGQRFDATGSFAGELALGLVAVIGAAIWASAWEAAYQQGHGERRLRSVLDEQLRALN